MTHRYSRVSQNTIRNVNLIHFRPPKPLHPIHERYFSNMAHTTRNAPTFTYGRNHLDSDSVSLFLLPIHPRESQSVGMTALTTTRSRISQNTISRSSLSRFPTESPPSTRSTGSISPTWHTPANSPSFARGRANVPWNGHGHGKSEHQSTLSDRAAPGTDARIEGLAIAHKQGFEPALERTRASRG